MSQPQTCPLAPIRAGIAGLESLVPNHTPGVPSTTSGGTPSKTKNNTVGCRNATLRLKKRLFKDKAEIKPWLQAQLAPKGITIVIARSDDSKIVFKCKSESRFHGHTHKGLRLGTRKGKKHCSGPEYAVHPECPFRIRANYSVRAGTCGATGCKTPHGVSARHSGLPYIQNVQSIDSTLGLSAKIPTAKLQLPFARVSSIQTSVVQDVRGRLNGLPEVLGVPSKKDTVQSKQIAGVLSVGNSIKDMPSIGNTIKDIPSINNPITGISSRTKPTGMPIVQTSISKFKLPPPSNLLSPLYDAKFEVNSHQRVQVRMQQQPQVEFHEKHQYEQKLQMQTQPMHPQINSHIHHLRQGSAATFPLIPSPEANRSVSRGSSFSSASSSLSSFAVSSSPLTESPCNEDQRRLSQMHIQINNMLLELNNSQGVPESTKEETCRSIIMLLKSSIRSGSSMAAQSSIWDAGRTYTAGRIVLPSINSALSADSTSFRRSV
ncbi:hypothetical protein HII13_005220 [Brettanomyces bruxellensis]|nr:hypothetical protein HII13_005220 [Brettanomyces bruxellensis]